MSKSINQVMLMGNLTKDPVMKQVGENTVTEFSLAMNREFVSKGEYREETEYMDVVVWGKQAELAAQYLEKGKRCLVQGRFRTRSWDDRETGQKRSKVEVVADDVTFLNKPTQIEVEHEDA